MDISDVVPVEKLSVADQDLLTLFNSSVPELCLELSFSTGKWAWSYRCDSTDPMFDSAIEAIANFIHCTTEMMDEAIDSDDDDDEYEYEPQTKVLATKNDF